MSDQVIDKAVVDQAGLVMDAAPVVSPPPVEQGTETQDGETVCAAAVTEEEPEYEPSHGAALLQDLIQRIDVRVAKRAECVEELRKVELATERLDREEQKQLTEDLEKAHHEYVNLTARLQDRFRADVLARKTEIGKRRYEIDRLDYTLTQMRKQVNAEVAKLAPDRKVIS